MSEPRKPKLIDFSLTTECNSDCLFCSVKQWARLHNQKRVDMDLDLMRSIVDQCPEAGTVILAGRCEPLLYRDIGEIIAHVKRRGKWIKTYTNASLLTESVGMSLLEAGLDRLICSVDECVAWRYERLRRGLKFDVMVENIERFVEMRNRGGYNTQVYVNILKTVETRDRIDEIAAYWGSRVDRIHMLKEEIDHLAWGPPEPLLYNGPDAHSIHCRRPFKDLTVYPPGYPVLCCVDQCFYPYGDLREQSVLEAFNSPIIEGWRHAMMAGKGYPTMCHRCAGIGGRAATAPPKREAWKDPPGIFETYRK